ncbi:UPF0158 family protein [Mitsuokella jalaludinii]|uniref:Uncharacterized protein family (UPF0158) n=1 Tax=Mitsuokella jalaludinii TaxID=187979 RepID=A0A174BIE7_9FIRM|nr:UPF0158 family protein [Mitsuokella jalaludinii]MCQ1533740.1 UPF0158 family protein [Mitsuokella jalaludinii]CUN99396.1 Uncharacterised protein family (UPF0158) [Mitsuokella jalaludinii]
MKVDLKELAAAFAQSDVRQGYVDTAAGKVIMMADDLAERDAMHYAMVMEEDWERYIPIPNIMDGDEAAMMRAFAESRPREAVKERLLTALQGAGAVTRFRHQVRHLLLKPAWEAFKQEYLMKAARDWCEENAVEYREP